MTVVLHSRRIDNLHLRDPLAPVYTARPDGQLWRVWQFHPVEQPVEGDPYPHRRPAFDLACELARAGGGRALA